MATGLTLFLEGSRPLLCAAGRCLPMLVIGGGWWGAIFLSAGVGLAVFLGVVGVGLAVFLELLEFWLEEGWRRDRTLVCQGRAKTP